MKISLKKNIHSQANVYAYMAQEMMELQYEQSRLGKSKDQQELVHILSHTEHALQLGCSLPLVHFTRGNVLHDMLRYNDSIHAYELALRQNNQLYLEPGTNQSNTDMLNQLALTYQARNDTGDRQRAVATFQRCLAEAPDMYEAMVNIGVLYADLGLIKEATEMYNRALTLAPNNAALLNNAAHLHLREKQWLKAYELSSKALTLMPEHLSVRTTYQLTLVGMGHEACERSQYEEALEWYYKAPKVQPAEPYVLEHIVTTMIKLGRVRDAVPHLERLVMLMKDRNDLIVLLEDLKRKLL